MRRSVSVFGLLLMGAFPASADAATGRENGVVVEVSQRTGTTIRVLRPERRRIVQRGGVALVTCGAQSDSFPPVDHDSASVEWPRGRAKVTVRRLRRGYQFCVVSVRPAGARNASQLAAVPLSARGTAMLEERSCSFRAVAILQKILLGADSRAGAYPTADQLARGNIHPLATPDALPPPEEPGAYSNETERRLRVVCVTGSGTAVFVELNQGEFRTNVPHWVANYLAASVESAPLLRTFQ